MKFFIIRHAEDSKKYIGGHSKISLTKKGRLQSIELRDFIIAHNNEFNIGEIISSDLPRAIQTVFPLAQKLHLDIKGNKLFRALDWGAINGLTVRQAMKQYPNFYLSNLEPNEAFPGGGESPNQFYNRVIQSWKYIHENYAQGDKNVLICTHGQQFNILLSLFHKTPWNYKTDYRVFHPCLIWEFDTDTKKMRPIMPLKEYQTPKKTPRRVFHKACKWIKQLFS